jgi:hypothetical protein
LSASQIAELGFCERFVVLSRRHGRQDPPDISAARRRGDRAHETFYAESVAIARGQRSTRPCFLAESVFPPHATELIVFRRVRDEVLARSETGRRCIERYYVASPDLSRAWDAAPAWAWTLFRGAMALCAVAVQFGLRAQEGVRR